MNWQKGFSLTEVLISLLLVTTLALALLQQQWQSKQLLNQLVFRTQGSQFLDQIEETLMAQVQKLPLTPSPYHLEIQHKNHQFLIQLAWYKQLGSITRKRNRIDSSPYGTNISQELRTNNPSSALRAPSPHAWGEGENEGSSLGDSSPYGTNISQELRTNNPSSALRAPSPHAWGEGENEGSSLGGSIE